MSHVSCVCMCINNILTLLRHHSCPLTSQRRADAIQERPARERGMYGVRHRCMGRWRRSRAGRVMDYVAEGEVAVAEGEVAVELPPPPSPIFGGSKRKRSGVCAAT